jgi:PST family polysaccharide transporter
VIATQVFAAPQAAPVLRAMAPTLVVGAATAAATASLSRDIEFKVIQLAGLGSYVIGYLVFGVAAATLGLGVWSLVIAWHVQTVLACAAMLWFSPHRLRPGNPFRTLAIARFGAVVMVTNMVNWVIDNGPHVAIGRWLGATALGQYTVSNNLVKVPADHLVRNLQAVLFPLASRAQDNDAGLRRAYLTVLGGVALVALPLFSFIAVMAEPIVLLLLGSKWQVAADILAPLSIAMIGHAIEALCGPVLGGRGEPKLELRVKAVTLGVMLAVLAVTASLSLAAVGWGVAAVYFFRWVWMNAAVMNRLSIGAIDVSRALLGPLIVAAGCCAVAWAVLASAANSPIGPAPWALIALAATGAALLSFALLQGLPKIVLGPQLLWLLNVMAERRPAIGRVPGLRRVVAAAVQQAA